MRVQNLLSTTSLGKVSDVKSFLLENSLAYFHYVLNTLQMTSGRPKLLKFWFRPKQKIGSAEAQYILSNQYSTILTYNSVVMSRKDFQQQFKIFLLPTFDDFETKIYLIFITTPFCIYFGLKNRTIIFEYYHMLWLQPKFRFRQKFKIGVSVNHYKRLRYLDYGTQQTNKSE